MRLLTETEDPAEEEQRSQTVRGAAAPVWLVVTAFVAVYVIWGSTYLGIRLAIDSMPPLLMAGARFFIAGVILYGAMRMRGSARPSLVHWRSAAIIGSLLLLAGNGVVSWAQQTVPSGTAALMVAATPLWINLADWLRPGGKRPTMGVFLGLALGFGGVALLVQSKDAGGQRLIDPLGAILLVLAPMSWALGSIYSRHARQAPEPLLNIGMQMITGGVALGLAGLSLGEAGSFHFSAITTQSALAFIYLTFIGSLVGFTAYVWLLQVSTPARVSTYAFVNPIIAVLLGALVLHERLTPPMLAAGALVVAAVALLTLRSGDQRSTRKRE